MADIQPVEYLTVAPHPDDAELGMGGVLVKLARAGRRIAIVDLTSGEPTPFGSPEKRRAESEAATKVLGLAHRENLGLVNRELEATLPARVRLAECFRRLRPRVVFVPYWKDAHPDHLAATQLAIQARFHAKLTKTDMAGDPHWPHRFLFYYCTHLRAYDDTRFVVDVSDEFAAKVRCIECYQSQFYEGRGEAAGAVVQAVGDVNRHWGRLIGRPYGEAFASQEMVGLGDLDGLI
jgi:bacillithiol biosynthesis deacetylase BshB1